MTTEVSSADRLHRYLLVGDLVQGRRVAICSERDHYLIERVAASAADVVTIDVDPFATDVRLELEAESFDVVLALTPVEGFAGLPRLLAEWARILRADGTLVTTWRGMNVTPLEIRTAAGPFFRTTEIYEQRSVRGSLLSSLDEPSGQAQWFVNSDDGVRKGLAFESPAATYLAFGTKGLVPALRPPSVLFEKPEPGAPITARPFAGLGHSTVARELRLRERQVSELSASVTSLDAHVRHVEVLAHERALVADAEHERLSVADRRSAQLQQQIDLLQSEVSKAHTSLAAGAAAIAERDLRLQTQAADLAAAQTEAAELAASTARCNAELAKVTGERDAAREHAERTLAAYRELVESDSWRLTKPLRLLARNLRRTNEGNR